MPVVEVRTYRTRPGRRAEFVELFQSRGGPALAECGMTVMGLLLDVEDPDVVVWLRGFQTEAVRETTKAKFYDGPIWKEDLEGLAMPLLSEQSAVICQMPPGFLDGPLRSPDWT